MSHFIIRQGVRPTGEDEYVVTFLDGPGRESPTLMSALSLEGARDYIRRTYDSFRPTEFHRYIPLPPDPPSPFSDEYDGGRGMPDPPSAYTIVRHVNGSNDWEVRRGRGLIGRFSRREDAEECLRDCRDAEREAAGSLDRDIPLDQITLPTSGGEPGIFNPRRQGGVTAVEMVRQIHGTSTGRMSSHLPPYSQADARAVTHFNDIAGTEPLLQRIRTLEERVEQLESGGRARVTVDMGMTTRRLNLGEEGG